MISCDTLGRASVSESDVSIGDSLQEVPATDYLAEEGHHNGTNGDTDLNNETTGKLDQSVATEQSDVQSKVDLSKAEESTKLNNEIAEPPTNITDNETTFTGNISSMHQLCS